SFQFDAVFSPWVPPETGAMRMELYQLPNASAIYASGFIAVFVLFGLLYHHAYASREQLQLSELEAFDARAEIGQHVVSVSGGVMSLLIPLLPPLPLVRFAPAIFFLMGPGHFWYGSRSGGQRRALEARLADVNPAAAGELRSPHAARAG